MKGKKKYDVKATDDDLEQTAIPKIEYTELIDFYKRNPIIFLEELCGIKLFPHQKLILSLYQKLMVLMKKL